MDRKDEAKKLASGPVHDALSALSGERVTLYLDNGSTCEGVLATVTQHTIHVSELVGKEFFDALIRADHVVGVEFRTKG